MGLSTHTPRQAPLRVLLPTIYRSDLPPTFRTALLALLPRRARAESGFPFSAYLQLITTKTGCLRTAHCQPDST